MALDCKQHASCSFIPDFSPRLQILDVCWGNEPVLNYMIDGHFVWRPTGPWRSVEYRHKGGAPPGDYVGLNFYSR